MFAFYVETVIDDAGKYQKNNFRAFIELYIQWQNIWNCTVELNGFCRAIKIKMTHQNVNSTNSEYFRSMFIAQTFFGKNGILMKLMGMKTACE